MFFAPFSRSNSPSTVRLAILLIMLFPGPMIGLGDEALPRGHYRLTGVKVVPIERSKVDGKTSDAESDKLTHWIRFDIHGNFDRVPGTEKLPFTILNRPDATKSRLTLDKPIKFQGKMVPAGTNLLKFKKFNGRQFNVMMPDPFPFAIHSVRIQSGFQIPADTYTVTFEWLTATGELVSDVVTVHIDVKLKD